MAKVGATYPLPFGQWANAFTQVTNLNAPTIAQSCTDDKKMTIDEYLATLEQVGSVSCQAVQYPTTYNGDSANDMLTQMNILAGTPSAYVYDWDQWAYYYQKVEGQPAPSPDTECMKTHTHPNSPSVTAYNRYLLLTSRQWLLFFEDMFFGCAS
jgi:hypothetical protein